MVGFANVGQKFDKPQYFSSRPSAAGYQADASAGFNKGPSNLDYLKEMQAWLDTFLVQNPDLSPQGALARVRALPPTQVQTLVQAHVETSLLGPAHVNVLRLNVALDALASAR